MVQFTFFEIHLDDASFGASSPFGGGSGADAEAGTVESAGGGSDDQGGPGVLPPLIGLLVLVGLAIAVRKLLGGGDAEEAVTDVDVEELTA